jgi:molybdopterin converting factor small subunit
LVLLGAGCGGSDDKSPSAESPKTAGVVVDSSQTYRDQLADIVSQPDDARRNFHNAPPGELTLASARQLASAAGTAAREIEELTLAAGLDELNRDLAEKYRRWAAALDRELVRKPVSTRRLGDAVREYGKAADDVYEQILIAP